VQTLGTVFAVNALRRQKDQKNEGILGLVAHKRKCVSAEQLGLACVFCGHGFLSDELSIRSLASATRQRKRVQRRLEIS